MWPGHSAVVMRGVTDCHVPVILHGTKHRIHSKEQTHEDSLREFVSIPLTILIYYFSLFIQLLPLLLLLLSFIFFFFFIQASLILETKKRENIRKKKTLLSGFQLDVIVKNFGGEEMV